MNYNRSARAGRGLAYRSHAERTVGVIKDCLAVFETAFEIPVPAQTCLQRDFISELSQPAQPGLKIAPVHERVGAAKVLGRSFSCLGRGRQDHE